MLLVTGAHADREILRLHGHVLTAKELEVCSLYSRGLSQRAIAFSLNLARSTVQSRLETATRRLRIEIEREAR